MTLIKTNVLHLTVLIGFLIKVNIQIADLLDPTYFGVSFLLPSLGGWYIYGGFGNCLTTMQQLPILNGKWQAGPDLYNNRTITVMCGAQV